MGVAGDLSALANAKKILGRKVAPGTANLARGPAMTRQQAVAALETGIDIANSLAPSTDIFGTGEMGIGNTTPSTAIVACITGTAVAEVTGRGTGIDDGSLKNKILVVERALLVNKPNPADGLDVLQKIGGFEIGGLAGLILGAAALKKPVIIDGFISTAAALIAHTLCPTAGEYMIAGHRSVEQGHRCMHNHLCKEPLLDLNLRLGEGTGATLAMNLVEAAARILTEVATFEEAAVSGAKS
jgi:nicotinate-nucleotide--dimethylbenzimidazole phosphoribosyltransferase